MFWMGISRARGSLKRGLKNVGDRGDGRGESTALFCFISMTRPNVSMRMALDYIPLIKQQPIGSTLWCAAVLFKSNLIDP